jgi:hypothetical protein
MNFKFFKGDDTPYLTLTPQTRFIPENVEFCFQFGNNEPIVFATGPNECSIRLSPTSDASMMFTDNDREFKLFARERQDD